MQDRLKAVGRRFADVPAGRRSKWVVLGVWLAIFFVIGPLAGKFEDAQENDPADYLPAKAESVKAIDELEDFPSGDISEAITVFNRDGGLTDTDRAAIDDTQAAINADRREGVGETGPPIYSEDGSSALLVTPITVEDDSNEAGDLLVDATDDIKAELGGSAGRTRGEGDRAGRLLGRRDRRLRLDRRHPAVRDRGARPGAADHHLPQPDLLADPVLLGDHRRVDLTRDGLPARRGRGDGDRPVGRDPAGARLRRRDRLRRCCSSRATARSYATTRTSTMRSGSRCARPARRSSPRA